MSPGRPRRSLGRDTMVSLVGVVMTRMCGAAGGVLTARLLGPSGKGRYAVLVLAGTALGVLATAGVDFWINRSVAIGGWTAQVRWAAARHLILAVGFLCAAAAITVAVIGGLGTSPVSRFDVWFVSGFAIAWVASMLAVAVPNGARRMGVVGVATAAGAGIFVLWCSVMWAVGSHSLVLALVGAAVANAVIVVPCLPSLRKVVRGDGSKGATPSLRGVLGFGGPAGIGEVLSLASLRLDVFLVALYLPAADVGLYAVASAVSEILYLVPNATAPVLIPFVAADDGHRSAATSARLVVAVSAVSGVVLVLLMRPLLHLVYGRPYVSAASAAMVLVPATILMGLWRMLAADLVGRGRTGARAASALVGLACMVACDVILIPRVGIVGAALGSVIGYGAATVWMARSWVRATGGKAADLFVVRRDDLERLWATRSARGRSGVAA